MKRLLAASILLLFVAVLAGTRPASAQTCYTGCNPPAQISPATGNAPAVSGATVSYGAATATAAEPQSSTQLAFTGADIAGMVIIASVLVGGGAIAVRISRSRTHHKASH